MSYSLSLDKYVGKVAVVTGASAGIGKAIVEDLTKHGLVVVAVARRLELLEKLANQLSTEKGKVHPFKCDLTNQEEILTTFKKITTEVGPIHILVNNAGMVLATTIIDGDIEKWKSVINTNLLAATICTREAISNMKSNNTKGHIINLNSVAGHMVPDIPWLNIYAATKHGLKALTETVRLEINREKLPIKITSISPGAVNTEFLDVAFKDKSSTPPTLTNDRPALTGDDVAAATTYVLSTPDHVNVTELTLYPQGVLY